MDVTFGMIQCKSAYAVRSTHIRNEKRRGGFAVLGICLSPPGPTLADPRLEPGALSERKSTPISFSRWDSYSKTIALSPAALQDESGVNLGARL